MKSMGERSSESKTKTVFVFALFALREAFTKSAKCFRVFSFSLYPFTCLWGRGRCSIGRFPAWAVWDTRDAVETMANKGQFQKGQPRHANAGRRPGSPNVQTREVRTVIAEACSMLGGSRRLYEWAARADLNPGKKITRKSPRKNALFVAVSGHRSAGFGDG
jgi:hypothetical protein